MISSRRSLLLAVAATAMAIAPAAHAASCDGATSQPFARWLDYAPYVPAPGGDFESGATGWTLQGARVVSGNESYNVSGGGTHSLSIPAGASATSPAFCGGLGYPAIRLFTKGGGLLGTGVLRVTINYVNGDGVLSSQPLGLVTALGSWQPSLQLVTLSGLPILTGSDMSVTLAAVSGTVSVDDVYVDPYFHG